MSACPINFDPYDIKYADYIFDIYENLRNNEPIYWNEEQQFWVISRHKDVTSGLKDYKTFTSHYGITPTTRINYSDKTSNKFFMERKDPPEHNDDRRILNRILNFLVTEDFKKEIKLNISSLLLNFNSGSDIISNVFNIYPIQTVSEMLGFDQDTMLMLKLETENLFNLSSKEKQDQSTINISKYIHRNPPKKLVNLKKIKIDNRELSDIDIIKFSIILIIAGYETVTNALSNLLIDLDDNRTQFDILLRNKELIPNAVEESLRLRRVAQSVMRTATRDIEMYGKLIKEGDSVVFLNGSANTDPNYIKEFPKKFLVNRQHDKLNLSFSYGPHYCPGAEIARMQLKFFLEEMVNKYPKFKILSKNITQKNNLSGRYWDKIYVELG